MLNICQPWEAQEYWERKSSLGYFHSNKISQIKPGYIASMFNEICPVYSSMSPSIPGHSRWIFASGGKHSSVSLPMANGSSFSLQSKHGVQESHVKSTKQQRLQTHPFDFDSWIRLQQPMNGDLKTRQLRPSHSNGLKLPSWRNNI